MKNNPNPVAVGMFVLGAVIIAVASVMIFGAAKFFTETKKFVSYFSESVNGLDVGAPLKYKGVAIGQVERIRITAGHDLKDNMVAVIYSIDLKKLRRKTDKEKPANEVVNLDDLINDGLRAKLNYQSIVTGMLYVELDFFAEKGAPFELKYKGTRLQEIPSSKSNLSEIAKSFERTLEGISKINFTGIAQNANTTILTLNQKIADIDTKALSQQSIKTLKNIDAILTDPNLKKALASTDGVLQDSRVFLKSMESDLNKITVSTEKTLSNIDSLIANLNSMVSPQAPLRFELAMLMRSLNESVNSLSNFTDYLQRNPNSLLTGKAHKNSEMKE